MYAVLEKNPVAMILTKMCPHVQSAPVNSNQKTRRFSIEFRVAFESQWNVSTGNGQIKRVG